MGPAYARESSMPLPTRLNQVLTFLLRDVVRDSDCEGDVLLLLVFEIVEVEVLRVVCAGLVVVVDSEDMLLRRLSVSFS